MEFSGGLSRCEVLLEFHMNLYKSKMPLFKMINIHLVHHAKLLYNSGNNFT